MNKDLPLVSIVTPSFNQGRFIEDTILSVKNQNYPNIEHIVVDGGSTDNTLQILRKYENEYNLRWISEPDEGQSDAVNKGFKMAKGEIIGWLNSDDVYFYKDVISYVVGQFKFHQDADVIYGDVVYFDKEGSIQRVCKTFNWDYKRLLRGWCVCLQPATFFRRKVILEHQLDKNLHLSMDFEFWLRLGKNFNFLRVNKILAGDRLYEGTKRLSNIDKHKMETERLIEKYGQDFGLSYHIGLFFDKLQLGYLRLKSVKEILKLRGTKNLAFDAKIPCKFTRIRTQINFKDALNLLRY